jgi:hypothetical protein
MLLSLLGCGLFIIFCGVALFLWVWDKKDEDTVFMSARWGGVFPASARFVRNEGKVLVLAGATISMVSLLIRG